MGVAFRHDMYLTLRLRPALFPVFSHSRRPILHGIHETENCFAETLPQPTDLLGAENQHGNEEDHRGIVAWCCCGGQVTVGRARKPK